MSDVVTLESVFMNWGKMNIFAILTVLFLASFHTAFADTIQTADLNIVESAIRQADADTLVIFDVDDVLITAKDQILQPAYRKFCEMLEKELESCHSEKEAEKLWSIIWLSRRDETVDLQMISLIKQAKKTGAKVMALTNAWTGPFGNIPSIEDWRLAELKSFGYIFQDSWLGLQPKIFKHLKTKDLGRFPLFKEGVAFTSNLSKGKVLKAFLDYAKLSPKKIIFIDDKKKHLESVEAFARGAGIRFLGFRYTAVSEKPKIPLNEKRARFQFQILQEEHKWLSDEEANTRLQG